MSALALPSQRRRGERQRCRGFTARTILATTHGEPIEQARDPLLAKGLPALRRARKRAEEIARATNTALVQVVDGEIVRVYPGREPDDSGEPNEIRIVLDIVHVLEYLWRAAYAFHSEGSPEAEMWVEDRLLALLNGRTAGEIGRSLRGMIESHGLDAKAAKPVMKCVNYLKRNARWLHYDCALTEGLPIATGVIEGACRHLVQDRMGRTGARWSLLGAEAVLRLRALRSSGDFDDYWQFHLAKEHERNHASHYADGVVPDPIPLPRPNLRVVK